MPKIIKNKKKPTKKLLLGLLLIVLTFHVITKERNYEKIYTINDFLIEEKYLKENNAYLFKITKEEKTFIFSIHSSYQKKKKLIESIEEIIEDTTTCLTLKSEYLKMVPQCIENENLIDYYLVNENMKNKLKEFYLKQETSKEDTYEKINIKNLDENTYYIWNYKGFYVINKNKKEIKNIFNKDIYSINNVVSLKNFIIIPDYNESYYFNKFYLLNTKNNKINTWEFKDSIYFDGYYLGSEKDSLFYVDKKNKIEWEISPKRQKMRKVGTEKKDGKILIQNKWEKITLNKLCNETKKFENIELYNYEIKEDGLYVKYMKEPEKKKISNQLVNVIVSIIQDKIYYLVKDKLYYYKEGLGEVEVMNYFEWNFNNQNMIFIKEN